MEREITKYSYIMIIALIISSLFNYLYQVVMGIMLPKHEFGILGVSLAIFFVGSVLTQNTFSWTGTRRMASQPEEVSKILRTTIAGNLALALLASLLILCFSYKSKTYFLPNLIVVIALLFSAFVNSYVSLLRAVKKFRQLATANIVRSLLRLFSAVVLIIIGLGAVGGVAGLLISNFIVLVYLAHYARKIRMSKSAGFVIDMIPETFFISIIFVSITFIVNSSIVFMRLSSGSDLLAGNYNAALTIARGPFFITTALITVLFPYISSPDTRREEYAFQSVKYIALFVFPVCVSMAVDPETWLNLFFGEKYMGGAEVLRLLSIGVGLISLAFTVSSNLVAFEKLKIPALCLFVASVVQIAFVCFFANPVLASALSVVVSSAVATILLVAYYTANFYFKGSTKHVLKITSAYSVLSAVFLLLRLSGRLMSLVEITASFLLYFLLLSILGLFDERDVEVVFSPLPQQSVEIIRKVVAVLNSVGRFMA